MKPAANQPYRVVGRGSRIGTKAVSFTFDGKAFDGLEGDTLASALLANGVHLMGRSFKYHRPRGVLAAGVEEPNALMQISRDAARTTPNVRASVQELYDYVHTSVKKYTGNRQSPILEGEFDGNMTVSVIRE